MYACIDYLSPCACVYLSQILEVGFSPASNFMVASLPYLRRTRVVHRLGCLQAFAPRPVSYEAYKLHCSTKNVFNVIATAARLDLFPGRLLFFQNFEGHGTLFLSQ